MTSQIVIDLHESTPVVFVDGVQVGVKIDLTYHREGGLQVRSLRVSDIPTDAEITASSGVLSTASHAVLRLHVAAMAAVEAGVPPLRITQEVAAAFDPTYNATVAPSATAAGIERDRYREALEEIAQRATVERNPDGDDQAAHTMQLIAREALNRP